MATFVFLMLIALFVASLVALGSLRTRRQARPIIRFTPSLFAVLAVPLTMMFWLVVGPGEEFAVILVVLALVLLVWFWVVEFVTLMGLGDDSFPGRFDKLVWAVLLILLPPAGMIAFGVFRRAYWATAKPAVDVASHELA